MPRDRPCQIAALQLVVGWSLRLGTTDRRLTRSTFDLVPHKTHHHTTSGLLVTPTNVPAACRHFRELSPPLSLNKTSRGPISVARYIRCSRLGNLLADRLQWYDFIQELQHTDAKVTQHSPSSPAVSSPNLVLWISSNPHHVLLHR